MTDPEHGRGDDQQNDEEDRGGVRATVITMMLRHGCAPLWGFFSVDQGVLPGVKTTAARRSRPGVQIPKKRCFVLNIFPNITFAHNC